MNIIQQQDRLKRLPEEVLIEYIANPTGEVPTFLAMGEIERRKVMRNKYAAQQAERPPISEQIVQESMAARMPRPMDMVGGLGRSNRQEALRRETAPQPPMPSSGDAGITALPTPNVGQNYAQGGVVGYAVGGSTNYDDYTRGLTFSDSVGGYTEEDMIVDDKGITFDESQFAISDPYGPETSLQNAGTVTETGKDAISDYTTLPLSTPYERYRQSQADYGMDENYYTRLREDIESDRDLVRDRSDVANMALINAGLGIASGTSQNALENIAKGAVPGLTSYTQGLKDLRDDERSIRKELRGVDALQRGESREDMMLDKKLIAQLEAAGIANSLDQKTYLLAARKDAREQIKSKGYDDLANVPDATVINLGS